MVIVGESAGIPSFICFGSVTIVISNGNIVKVGNTYMIWIVVVAVVVVAVVLVVAVVVVVEIL